MIEIAVDTETTGIDVAHGCKPFLVTACDGPNLYYWKGRVNPYNRAEVEWQQGELDSLQEFIDKADTIIFHNAKFDIKMLATIGIKVPWHKVQDTMVAAHCICSGESKALKYLALKYLGMYNDEERALAKAVKAARLQYKDTYDIARKGHPCFPSAGSGKKTKWYKMDYWLCMDECLLYGMSDVVMTWFLWRMQEDVILKEGLLEQYETRRELIKILYDMERTGLHAYLEGPKGIKQQIRRLRALQEVMRAKIQEEVNLQNHLNLADQAHVRMLFFDILKLPVLEVGKSGRPSLKKDIIEKYLKRYPENKVLKHFQEWRTCVTQIGYLSSYLKSICNDNRIRSNFLLTGTRETRQTSNDPNVQNIDKRLRDVFGPPEGYVWLDYDLVNIEMRTWVYEVDNKELVAVFDKGGSVHLLVAETIHTELTEKCKKDGVEFNKEYKNTWYQWTKNGNFAIIYGATERKADQTYKIQGAYQKIAKRFPEVPAYTQKTIREAEHNDVHKLAPFVTCLGGYRLEVDMNEPFKACNYKIQGTAGYIIGVAMINIVNNPLYKQSGAQIVNQVHDSIIIEVKEENCTEELTSSLQESIEEAGRRFIPTCDASFEIIHPPKETFLLNSRITEQNPRYANN